jgi:hypothetical protein
MLNSIVHSQCNEICGDGKKSIASTNTNPLNNVHFFLKIIYIIKKSFVVAKQMSYLKSTKKN